MKKLLILFPFLMVPFWGFQGHRAVALIAQKHLTTPAQAMVSAYLGSESIADVSTWADEHRSPQTAMWHYINLPMGLSREAFEKAVKSSENNIYEALVNTEKTLQNEKAAPQARIKALKYLIHLVGDAHQPMHVSRKEDKGGNGIQVRFEDKGTNLHALWDSGLIGKEGLSEDAMAKSYDTATAAEIKAWQSDGIIQWLWESYEITNTLYAGVKPGQKIDKAYYDRYIPVIRKRINMAGIRLAGELNRIFADQKPVTVIEKKVVSANDIELSDMGRYVDQNVTVSGKVYSIKDVKSMVLVNVGGAYPNQPLTVVLKSAAKALASGIDGKEITVTGTVLLYKGKPEIIVTDPSKLRLK